MESAGRPVFAQALRGVLCGAFVTHRRKPREPGVPTAEERALLMEYPGKGKSLNSSVFGIKSRQSVALIVKGAARATGLLQKLTFQEKRFSAQCLRHAFATRCYENGMSLLTLKKLLGHRFIATTLTYVYTSMHACAVEYARTNPFTGSPSASPDSRM